MQIKFTFSWDGYRQFLLEANELAEFHTVSNFAVGPGIYLRHDIDLCLESAYHMALLEKELGIASTYYVMATSNTYNILTKRNRSIIEDMAKMGHEIGLHFDHSVYADASKKMNNKLLAESDILYSIIQSPVRSYSSHNPSMSGIFEHNSSLVNAYDPKIFSVENYLSDSRMKLKQEPISFVKERIGNNIQLLFHPIHFSGNGTYIDVLSKKFSRDIISLDLAMQQNSGYTEQGSNLRSLFAKLHV